jgi:hypothetical protein
MSHEVRTEPPWPSYRHYYGICPEGLRKIVKKKTVSMAGVMVEILNRNFLNMNRKIYRLSQLVMHVVTNVLGTQTQLSRLAEHCYAYILAHVSAILCTYKHNYCVW